MTKFHAIAEIDQCKPSLSARSVTMKTDKPNAAQTRWREAVRELGSVISGGPAVIHHCVGRTAKHNKVQIGHWWILPLTDSEHKALHNGETFGRESRKSFEKEMYVLLINYMLFVPPSEVNVSIASYHR